MSTRTVNQQRSTITFAGQVQGVGFRMTAVRFGRDYAVAGTVRNLSSGDVELIVQGPAEDITALARRLCEHFDASMRMVHHAPVPAIAAAGIQIVH